MKDDQFTKSSKGLGLIKIDEEIPRKVLVETNTLNIPVKIHSFYWPYELGKIDDYEPIAFGMNEEFCLSRFHYHGIVIWKDYNLHNKLPIIYFGREQHTPFLCSAFEATVIEPLDIISKMFVKGYFLRIHNSRRVQSHENYVAEDYSGKIVEEDVPPGNAFTWNDINYYIIISRAQNMSDLAIDENVKGKIDSVVSETSDKIRAFPWR